MKQRMIFFAIVVIFLALNSGLTQGLYPSNHDYYYQFAERQKLVSSAIASQAWMVGDDHRARIYRGVLKIATGIDRDRGLELLREAVNDSAHWWCFNVYSMMDAILRLGDRLPPELIEKAKLRMRTHFGADKGFTENHRLQYRTARYLFAQAWPQSPPFADGMTPAQAKKEAEDWINDWIERTVTVGMLEYDSVNYMSLYFLTLSSLYDFSTDPLMKRKAWMMLQLLAADWAAEYLRGNWIGGHSREKYNQVTHTILNCGTAQPVGFLFFGDAQLQPELPETYYSGLAAIQGFRPLPLIGNIATDRSTPYVQIETKAPRDKFGDCVNNSKVPTWKYDYVTKDYALCSSYGSLTAVENHLWDLTWVSEKDGSICFFINPSYSAEQLLKFFKDDPDKIIDDIVRQRPYYADANKWIEGSPYEKLLQHENTLIALYDIPKKERNGHVNGFFSKIIEQRVEEDGWIFCQTDSIYFAVRTLTKGEWHEEDDHFRLRLNNRKTGLVMEVAQVSEFPSFEAFKARIKSNPLKIDRKNLHVVYTNSRRDVLDFTYPDERFINGEKMDFSSWGLFEGPFINAKMGSKIFEIKYGKEKVILDFNDFLVKYLID